MDHVLLFIILWKFFCPLLKLFLSARELHSPNQSHCTCLCFASLEECGRYLETIKVYENKPADLIQGQMDSDYLSRVRIITSSLIWWIILSENERLNLLIPSAYIYIFIYVYIKMDSFLVVVGLWCWNEFTFYCS